MTEQTTKPYVVMAHRSAASLAGPDSRPCKSADGEVMRFATHAEAETQARIYNERTRSPNVHYTASGDANPKHQTNE
jgi:hypothetical protein